MDIVEVMRVMIRYLPIALLIQYACVPPPHWFSMLTTDLHPLSSK